jgi:hypothetical protein
VKKIDSTAQIGFDKAMNNTSKQHALLLPVIFMAGFAFFYLTRNLGLPGGDTGVVLSDMWRAMLWDPARLTYYAREPWCHALVRQFYFRTGQIVSAYQLYCAFSGGLFLALLAWYCRRPLFWAVMLCAVGTWNFVGHVEYYAPEMVTLLLFLVTLSMALEPVPRAKPVHVAATFALSYLFHKLTLFFLPATLWLFFERRQGRWVKRPQGPRQAEWSLVIIILMVLADVLPGLLFNYNLFHLNGMYVCVNEGLMDLLTPLTPGIARHFEAKSITGMFYVYTFGTWKHWAYFFGFLLAGAPLGLPLVVRHWRRIRDSQAALALATAAACGVIWIFMWQPRGFWKDWDLFCMAGLPVNFLGAGLALGLWRGQPAPRASRRQWVASGAALALFFLGMSLAAPVIQKGRLQPGRLIEDFRDVIFSEKWPAPGPVPFERIERDYGVKLDRAGTRAAYVFPYAGPLKYVPGIANVFVVSVDRTGKIAAVAPGGK